MFICMYILGKRGNKQAGKPLDRGWLSSPMKICTTRGVCLCAAFDYTMRCLVFFDSAYLSNSNIEALQK